MLLVTHVRPDGDALGSMQALALAARRAGKDVHVVCQDVPARYDFLFAGQKPAGPKDFPDLAARADTIALLDTCSAAQLEGLAEPLRQAREKVIVLDHHATRDEIGLARWLDVSAAATGVLVYEALTILGWPIELPVADALMVAVASDTGWFQFANTDSRCLCVVSSWLDLGGRPDELYRRLFQSDRPERLKLIGRLLESLELHGGGRLAVMVLRKADFACTGARPEETENLVNEALRLGGVEEAVLLVEQEDQVRVSLRSRDAVDVAAVACAFGGGGHSRAAGFRARQDIDALKQRVIAACTEELKRLPAGPP